MSDNTDDTVPAVNTHAGEVLPEAPKETVRNKVPKELSKNAKRKLAAKQKLSKKAQKHIAKANARLPRPASKEEGVAEALERMQYMEMDDLYKERQFQQQLVNIIESERGSTKWSPQDKMRAVMAYMVTASTWQAEEVSGIPRSTIKFWKETAAWWPKALEYARSAKKESLVSKLGVVQDLALEAVTDRLKGGDYKYDARNGEQYRIPISAKDAMAIAAMSQDKGAVLRGEATNITEKRGSQSSLLDKIAEKLEKAISYADSKVIDGIVISKTKGK